jgi:hypothetical protein
MLISICRQLESHMFHRIPSIALDLVMSIEEFLNQYKALESECSPSPATSSTREHANYDSVFQQQTPAAASSSSRDSKTHADLSISTSDASSVTSPGSPGGSSSSSGSLRRRLRSQEGSVRKICAQLKKTTASATAADDNKGGCWVVGTVPGAKPRPMSPRADDFREIVQQVASLGHAFTRLVNIMLTGQIDVS